MLTAWVVRPETSCQHQYEHWIQSVPWRSAGVGVSGLGWVGSTAAMHTISYTPFWAWEQTQNNSDLCCQLCTWVSDLAGTVLNCPIASTGGFPGARNVPLPRGDLQHATFLSRMHQKMCCYHCIGRRGTWIELSIGGLHLMNFHHHHLHLVLFRILLACRPTTLWAGTVPTRGLTLWTSNMLFMVLIICYLAF